MKLNELLDISNEEYHSHPALSKSGINTINNASPKEFWQKYIQKEDEAKSEALIKGQLFHTSLTESEKVKDTFYVLEKGKRTTKAIEKEAGNRMIVRSHWVEEIDWMVKNVMAHPVAKLLTEGLIEKSVFWEHEGITLKTRPDVIIESTKTIVDFKTIQRIEELPIERSMEKYGYWLQAFMGMEGLKAAYGEYFDQFIIVWVEKCSRGGVMIDCLDPHDIINARHDLNRGIKKYKECMAKNEWPTGLEENIRMRKRTPVPGSYLYYEDDSNLEGV